VLLYRAGRFRLSPGLNVLMTRPDRFRALLRDLTADDRILLECRIVDGWQYNDIATRLGVSRDVLKHRVHQIRTDLRRKAKALQAS
jgi:DNA-directed RNA polymerase specialized sigma24 family protein